MLDTSGVASSLIILSLLAIILNTFCLHIIRTKKAFRSKPSTVFLINLLLTHLFQAIVVLPMYVGKAYKTTDLFSKRFFKNGFLFSYLLSFYGVCFGVLLISLDRFLATYLLNKYKVRVTFRSALFAILGTWIYILIICLIPFVPKSASNVSTSNQNTRSSIGDNKEGWNTTTSASANDFLTTATTVQERRFPQVYFYTPQDEWTVFMLFFNAALPFVLIVLCYVYVLHRIRSMEITQHSYKVQHEQSPLKPVATPIPKIKGFKKYKRLTYFTLVLCFVYFILWTPSIIYYTVLSVCELECFPPQWDGSKTEKYIVFIIKFLSYCNALLSPGLYCLRHPEMKKSMRQFLGLPELPSEVETETSKTVGNTAV